MRYFYLYFCVLSGTLGCFGLFWVLFGTFGYCLVLLGTFGYFLVLMGTFGILLEYFFEKVCNTLGILFKKEKERKKESLFKYTVMFVAQEQHAGGHEADLHSLKFTGTVGIFQLQIGNLYFFYFLVLLGTFRYFWELLGTFGYFLVLMGMFGILLEYFFFLSL